MGIIVLSVPIGAGIYIWERVQSFAHISVHPASERFHVTVLEARSHPPNYQERLRVEGPDDFKAGIWLYAPKAAGIVRVNDARGPAYYQERNPHEAGVTEPIEAKGGVATCDILVRLSATAAKTRWHSEIDRYTENSTVPTSLTVTDVQTQWPAAYPRDSLLPLAKAGDYVIMLSIK